MTTSFQLTRPTLSDRNFMERCNRRPQTTVQARLSNQRNPRFLREQVFPAPVWVVDPTLRASVRVHSEVCKNLGVKGERNQ